MKGSGGGRWFSGRKRPANRDSKSFASADCWKALARLGGGGGGGGTTMEDSDVIDPLLRCMEDPLVGGVGGPLLLL